MVQGSIGQPASSLTSSTNPNVVPTARQTTASVKDDASIASSSSGCGSLTKKKSQAVVAGKIKFSLRNQGVEYLKFKIIFKKKLKKFKKFKEKLANLCPPLDFSTIY
jgi:hypothetical protein